MEHFRQKISAFLILREVILSPLIVSSGPTTDVARMSKKRGIVDCCRSSPAGIRDVLHMGYVPFLDVVLGDLVRVQLWTLCATCHPRRGLSMKEAPTACFSILRRVCRSPDVGRGASLFRGANFGGSVGAPLSSCLLSTAGSFAVDGGS